MTSAIHVHLAPSAYLDALRRDVHAGLTATPKTLPPKYFYDARGSELFDQITRLPEYYPTRAEAAILRDRATEIAATTGAHNLVELGSGTSEKTRLLLHALADAGTLQRFTPFDVDPAVLAQAAAALSVEFSTLEVHGVVGDFEEHLGLLPRRESQLIAFLGSTIGNLEPAARARFFADIRSVMRPGDAFLLGTDLVKDAGRLVCAYDDAAGVTAEFNRNVLAVVNRELAADFAVDAFKHVALWDDAHEWIEMRLLSTRAQTVTVGDLGLQVHFAAGEQMRTEISAKFRREGISAELASAGLDMVEFWTDPEGDFGLSLSVLGTDFVARILIPLPDNDFDVTEVAVPWRLLSDAGHEVVFATEHGGSAPAADQRLIDGVLFGQLGAEPEPIEFYRQMIATDEYGKPSRGSR